MRNYSVLFSLVLVCSIGRAAADEPPLDMVLQTGHTGAVTSLALSRDGKHLVTGATDGTSILWEVATGKVLRTFAGNSVTMSDDGKRLLTVAVHTAILSETVSGKTLRTFTGDGWVRCAALSRDGRRVVTGSSLVGGNWEGTVAVWDAASGKKIQACESRLDSMSSLFLSDDGKVVLGASDAGAVLWAADTGKMLRGIPMRPAQDFVEPEGPFGQPQGAKVPRPQPIPDSFVFALSGDGTQVFFGSTDRTAGIAPVAVGKPIQVFKGQAGSVRCVAMSADGKLAVTGAAATRPQNLAVVVGDKVEPPHKEDGKAILWDTAGGKKLQTFDPGTDGISSVALSADNKLLVTASGTQVVLWDIASGKKIRAFPGAQRASYQHMAVSRDGTRIATTANDRTATGWAITTTLWDSAGPRKIDVGSAMGLALSGDGKFLLTGAHEKTTLWETAGNKQLQTFAGSPDVSLSDDGKTVVTYNSDGIHLWDAASGKKIQSIMQNTNIATGFLTRAAYFSSSAASADGKFILTGAPDGKSAQLWEAARGEKLRSFTVSDKEIRGVFVSGDGKRVVTRTSLFEATTVIVWDADTGKRVVTFNVAPYAFVGLTSDGKHVLSGDDYGMSVVVWEAATGKKVQTLHGHTGQIVDVALAADGNLWTASHDGTIRLWGPDGKERCRLYRFDAGKEWLVVTPDGLFDGSPGARRFVAYRELGTLNLADDDAPRKRFHRPGLLAQVWQEKIANDAWSARGALASPPDGGRRFLADDGQIGTIRRFILSADGATLVTDGTDELIRFWDAKTGKLLRRFEGAGGLRGGLLSLSPDARWFLTGPHVEPLVPIVDDGLILRDAATGKKIRSFQLTASDDDVKKGGRRGSPIDGIFSPDGKTLAIASEYKLHYHFFDPATGKELRQVCWCPGGEMSSSASPCRWSPDGQRFAGLYARQPLEFTVALWNMASREPQIVSEAGTYLRDMAFSADGEYLAWSDDKKKAHVWDVRASREIKTLAATDWFGHLAFSPDGKYLAAGKTLHPLNTRDPTLQLPFEPRFPAFSRDSRTLLVLSPDNNVLAFDVEKLATVNEVEKR